MCSWVKTRWDERAFGFDTFEIQQVDEETLKKAESVSGHFTVRVAPLQSKQLLYQHGFYYCDTLVEPYCDDQAFTPVFREDISIAEGLDVEQAQAMCRGVFKYDRYHRDFHIPENAADLRYVYWVKDIAERGTLYGLWVGQNLAGFFACEGHRILLHAITENYRGQGLAKYFWSEACQALFNNGYKEIISSISMANMPVLNLYRTLGFSFRNPMDIYHKFNPPRI